MEKIVDVQINKTNALITLGSMYRSAADAIKEYVSNALDEWAIARSEGRGEEQCRVAFTLEKKASPSTTTLPAWTPKALRMP